MMYTSKAEQSASILVYLEVGVRRKLERKRSSGPSFPYRIIKKFLWLHYSRVDICLRSKPRDPKDVCPYHSRISIPPVAPISASPAPDILAALPVKGPSAPSLSLVLFNSEEHSDLVFFVGQDGPKQWRFPAHSFVVIPASPVLESLVARCRSVLEDSIPEEYRGLVEDMKITNDVCQITITGTQPDVFESLLRFIYTRKVTFQCVSGCLRILSASLKFQVSSLSHVCLEYLSDKVTESNVLEVLSGVRSPCPKHADEDDNLRNELITKCFSLIDGNADLVLGSESFENLDQSLVLEIASRDTLRATSEIVVFNALMKWSCQECKRRRIELLVTNKREILGDALYNVRFLLMTQEEFTLGPAISGMLTDAEQRSVLSKLAGDKAVPVPTYLRCNGRDVPQSCLKLKPEPHSSKNMTECSKNKQQMNQNGPSCALASNKKPRRSKLLNGLGDIMIGVFTLLD